MESIFCFSVADLGWTPKQIELMDDHIIVRNARKAVDFVRRPASNHIGFVAIISNCISRM